MDTWRFISHPDLFNADFADLSGGADPSIAAVFGAGYGEALTQAPGWRPGGPNSMDAELAQLSLDALRMAVELAGGDPKALLVAGDLIQGRWPQNAEALIEMFGDGSGSLRQAIGAAAEVHYGWYRELVRQAGIDLFLPALGDHEIGDNNWRPGGARANNVLLMKEAFGEAMVDPLGLPPLWNGVTSRAPQGAGQYDEASFLRQVENVLFVTVDVFRFEGPNRRLDPATGAVRAEVEGAHLAWLREALAAAEADGSVDHVIVQGHASALGPVNARNSSNLSIAGGGDSAFWRTLSEFGTANEGKVRLYLAGESHATTTIQDEESGIVQITHGRLGALSPAFTVFEVSATAIRATEYEFRAIDTDRLPERFEVGFPEGARSPDRLEGPTLSGTLELGISGSETQLEATGSFDGYKGPANGVRSFVGGSGDDAFAGVGSKPIRVFGLAGADQLAGARGGDEMFGGAGGDTLLGRGGDDRLVGGGGKDILSGGSGADRLVGGAGADVIDGGRGDDTLRGGGGEDIFVFRGRGDDVVRDFRPGADSVDLTAFGIASEAEFLSAITVSARGALLDLAALGGAGSVFFARLDGLDPEDVLL